MIAIGSDHGGYKLKELLKRYLEESGIKFKDFGCDSEESVDYPNIAKQVAKSIQTNECDKGILICRTGFGMSIAANKYKGIRCVACRTEKDAKLSRSHNNSNILALGADELTESEAVVILRMWLATEFDGGRHQERINLIKEIEEENMK